MTLPDRKPDPVRQQVQLIRARFDDAERRAGDALEVAKGSRAKHNARRTVDIFKYLRRQLPG